MKRILLSAFALLGLAGMGNAQTYLSNGLGDFTIENASALPSGVSFVWEWSTQYNCAKATSYINGQAYATDSYLVSPEINLGTATTASVEQALNYLRDMNMDDNIGIYVREGASGSWNRVSYTNPPTGTNFNFVTSEIDLSAYTGKTVQVGFRYTATTEGATTWEIKNFTVGGQVTTPSTPEGESVTFSFSDPSALGFEVADGVTEIAIAGQTITKDGVTITFAQADGASTDIRLFKSSAGLWSFRFYKDTSFTVTSPDGTHLNGIVFAGNNLDKNWSYSSGSFAGTTWFASTETDNVTIGKTATGDNPIIDSLTVYYSDGEFVPGTPGTPDSDFEKVTFNFGDPTAYGFNPDEQTEEILLDGKKITSGIVTLSFAQNDGVKTGIRFFKSQKGQWSFRFYKDTFFTVSLPEGCTIGKIDFAGTNIGIEWSMTSGTLDGKTWTATDDTNKVTFGRTNTGNNPIIDTLTVYYTVGAGVEDIIAADDSQAVYYNLQGQKVANPERGIFIKVVNGKSVKIMK